MSTPRTDAEEQFQDDYVVDVEFSRILERENNELREENKKLLHIIESTAGKLKS